MIVWTEDMDNMLTRMWAEGITTKRIAHELGLRVAQVSSHIAERRRSGDESLPHRAMRNGGRKVTMMSVTIDSDTADHLRREAQSRGLTTSGYLRQILNNAPATRVAPPASGRFHGLARALQKAS